MIKVKILESCKHTGIKKGEVYIAKPFHQDPETKAELMYRESDGKNPMCSEYWSNLKVLPKDKL